MLDYYQLLNCSPTSTLDTIERHFKQLIQEFSAKGSGQTEADQFKTLTEAYETLKTPERRKKYDTELQSQQASQVTKPSKPSAVANPALSQSPSSPTMDDTTQRYQILSQLCTRRRSNLKNPGLPASSLVALTGCDEMSIEFHLWYFQEKGWIRREESGVYSISAAGVDRLDEMNLA